MGNEEKNARRSLGLNEITDVLREFISAVMLSYGSFVTDIILYGSYARGDYNEWSDIDVMILMNVTDEEAKHIQKSLVDVAVDLELNYGKSISPTVKSKKFFSYWEDTLPFYMNVRDEGVRLA